MSAHNLGPWGGLLAVITFCAVADPNLSAGSDPPIPNLTVSDQQFLSRQTRHAYDTYMQSASLYESAYPPKSLIGLRGAVVVGLRFGHHLLGTGASEGPSLPRTLVEATAAAIEDGRKSGREFPPSSADLLVEVEWVGSEVPIDRQGLRFQPGMMEALLEHGVDGFSISDGQRTLRVCPMEIVAKNQRLSDAFMSLVQTMGGHRPELSLSRFRSQYWYQDGDATEIVSLRRGVELVRQEDVDSAAVHQAIENLGQILSHRQRESGLFRYLFEPTTDRWADGDDFIHQAGATWALAEYARRSADDGAIASAERALQVHWERLVQLESIEDGAFIASPELNNPLGLTAQVAMAAAAARDGNAWSKPSDRLFAGMLWLQKPSGEFITAFPPARRLMGLDSYPGMTLLALGERYRAKPGKELLEALNRAHQFYRDEFRRQPSVTSAAWLQWAFARLAVICNRRDFARSAFEWADWLATRQLTAAECPWPELVGGLTTRDPRIPDAITGVCLSGWCESLAAARHFGETERITPIDLAARRAARFVLQLQFREREAHWYRDRENIVGGVRTSLADNRLPLENLQHALQALIRFDTEVLQRNH